MEIFTLGHSNRSLEEFLEILKKFNVELVVDVRRFPQSKKFPWFSKENLEKVLKENKINYVHFPELGGFRKEGYENFSKSEEFFENIKKLLEIVDKRICVILCAESFWWRCHRKYIANTLVNLGFKVIHILNKEKVQAHSKDKEVEEKMKFKIFCDKIFKENFSNSVEE